MKKILVLMIVSVMVLSGCAGLNKDECLMADWYQIGYEDGARGYPDTRMASHRKSCAKHSVSPDFRLYKNGHQEGVVKFCTPGNGFTQGKNGYQYSGICPSSLEDGFLDGYEAGRQIFAAASDLNSIQNEQRSIENTIDRLKKELIHMEALMFANETPKEERRNIYNSISLKQEELATLEERYKYLIVDIVEAQRRLRIVNEQFSYY